MGCSSSGAAPLAAEAMLMPHGGSDSGHQGGGGAPSAGAKPKLKRALTVEHGALGDVSVDDDGSPSPDLSMDGDRMFPPGYSVLQSHLPASKPGLRRVGSFGGNTPSADSGGAATGIQAVSMKGQKAESPNQDAWIVVRSGTGFSLYGVFDGHGKNGHDVSHYVKVHLPQLILEDPRIGGSSADMVSIMRDAFAKMDAQIIEANKSGKLKAQKSGTTATVALLDHNRRTLTISHVGDSGCAIASGSKWKARYLTPDHKPNLPAESKRIYKAGGAITYDGNCYRVHKKGAGGPQLNMSRSFGDLWGHEVGVISMPDTMQVKVSSADHLIVLCSDGVWEHMSAQDAVDALRQGLQKRPDNAAHELGRAASDLWAERNENGTVDDITVLLVNLQEQPGVTGRDESMASDSGIRAFLRRADSRASFGGNASGEPSSPRASSPKAKATLKRSDSNVSAASNGDGGGGGGSGGAKAGQVRSALKRSGTTTVSHSSPSRALGGRAADARTSDMVSDASRTSDASRASEASRGTDATESDVARRILSGQTSNASEPSGSEDFALDPCLGEFSPKIMQSVAPRPRRPYFVLSEQHGV
mmetsp:Transcript_65422/g.188481  ORF Transcript_65422/g.188481 Transcript_65422/m.188481 type:complete len:588 (-) Transcript_65422:201-1964(-)